MLWSRCGNMLVVCLWAAACRKRAGHIHAPNTYHRHNIGHQARRLRRHNGDNDCGSAICIQWTLRNDRASPAMALKSRLATRRCWKLMSPKPPCFFASPGADLAGNPAAISCCCRSKFNSALVLRMGAALTLNRTSATVSYNG